MAKRYIVLEDLFGFLFSDIIEQLIEQRMENTKLLMTDSRTYSWRFSDLEKYIQIKCKFFTSV